MNSLLQENEIVIRVAANNLERESARQLINEAFKHKQHISRKDRDPITILELDELVNSPSTDLLLLFLDNVPVGAVFITIQPATGSGLNAVFRFLAIDLKLHGRGYGTTLLLNAEKRAREKNCENSIITIIHHPQYPQSGLVAWYERHGYQYQHKEFISEINKEKWFLSQHRSEITINCYIKKLV